jgi:hypothetical protein
MRRLALFIFVVCAAIAERPAAAEEAGIKLVDSAASLPLYDGRSGERVGRYVLAQVRVVLSHESWKMFRDDQFRNMPRFGVLWLQTDAKQGPRWRVGHAFLWPECHMQVAAEVALDADLPLEMRAGRYAKDAASAGEGVLMAQGRVLKAEFQRRAQGRVNVYRHWGLVSAPQFCALWLLDPRNRLVHEGQAIDVKVVDAVNGTLQVRQGLELSADRLRIVFGETGRYVKLSDLAEPDADLPCSHTHSGEPAIEVGLPANPWEPWYTR